MIGAAPKAQRDSRLWADPLSTLIVPLLMDDSTIIMASNPGRQHLNPKPSPVMAYINILSVSRPYLPSFNKLQMCWLCKEILELLPPTSPAWGCTVRPPSSPSNNRPYIQPCPVALARIKTVPSCWFPRVLQSHSYIASTWPGFKWARLREHLYFLLICSTHVSFWSACFI